MATTLSPKTVKFDFKLFLKEREPHAFMKKLTDMHGDFIHLFGPGPLDTFIVNDPNLIKTVLKETNTNFDKESLFYRRLKQLAKSGLLAAEGEDWKTARKLLQPLFTRPAMKNYFSTMKKICGDRIEHYETQIDREFDLLTDMNSLALKVALEALLARQVSAKMIKKITAWTDLINEYCAKMPYPIISEPWFPTLHNIRTHWAMRQMRRYVTDSINQWQDDGIETVLSCLIKARNNGTMSHEDVILHLITMIIGGYETTSTSLTWFFYCIANQPDVEKKVLEEIESVVGTEDIDFTHIAKLTYTRAALDESMRLYPSIWFENRNVANEVTLGETVIPKGKLIVFSRYSLQRNPRVWENPNEFKAERFLEKSTSELAYASVPFGGGPRICIGINFALLEMLCFIASVLPKYRLELSPKYRHVQRSEVSLFPKYGMPVYLRKRKARSHL